MELYLRKANALDKKIVYDWANDPLTRQNSFQSAPISWESHEKWYEEVMESMVSSELPQTVLYICMNVMQPVGTVRIRIDEKKAVISYQVAPECRGLGYGKKMLLLLEEEIRKHYPGLQVLEAEVKPENQASSHIFCQLGYEMENREKELVFSKQLPEVYKPGVKTRTALKSEAKTKSKTAQNPEEKTLPEMKEPRENVIADFPKTEMKYSAATKARRANLELLRVLAMLMVIVLHYLSKGGLLKENLAQSSGLNNWLCWSAEAFCLAAVNVYVLISGYFLADHRFRLGKLVRLWCQVFFYSVLTALVLMALGMVNYRDYMDLYQLQFFLLPVINGHYWFASAYVVMYLFSPVLAAGMQKLNQRQHGLMILLLLGFFSLSKSLLPFELPMDDKGNGCIWFLCLFLIAGYYRRYGLKFLEKKGRGWLVYFLSSAGIILSFGFAVSLYKQTGKYENYLTIPLAYNFIFVLTASLGLFAAFEKMKVKENALIRFIVRLAPYTFGVYLLHEHLLLRYAWPEWLMVSRQYGWLRPVHFIASVLLIFSLGVLVDFLRERIFRFLEKIIIRVLKIYFSKREVWDYLIFGALTTVVNWLVYIFFAYFVLIPFLGKAAEGAAGSVNALVSNTIAWIAAVLFAYLTNRRFVFHSEVKESKAVRKEFLSFVSARVFSFLVEQAMFFVMVTLLHFNDLISKFVIGFVVIVLNYIFSKLWIFKKKT